MALLDRLLPTWRHSDPEVRAAAVRELGKDAHEVLASVARSDADVRVRRIAVRKIDDPELLLEVGRADADAELRTLASARADELLVERAISRQPVADCAKAAADVTRPSHRVTIAIQAFHPSVRRAALSGVSEERPLAEIARRSDDVQIGLDALAGVSDATLLRRIAAGGTRPEVALAALARLTDADLLLAIADDPQAQKTVRKRARAMLEVVVAEDHPIRLAARRERQLQLCGTVEALGDVLDPDAASIVLRQAENDWRDLAARAAPELELADRFRHACEIAVAALARAETRTEEGQKRAAARLRAYTTRQQLCETVEGLEGAETPAQLDAARGAWRALSPSEDPRCYELAARFTLAVERCEARYERWRMRDVFRSQLDMLVREAEQLVAAGDPHAAARPRAALEKRWTQLESSPEGAKWLTGERTLQRRFVEAGEALRSQVHALKAERQQREREGYALLTGLCARLEHLTQAETFRRTAAERALEAAAETLRQFPPLPAAERDVLRQRLTVAQQNLARRLDEQGVAEGWKLWANAEVQQQLIARAEALLAADDPKQLLRELGVLEREWTRVASAPRDQSLALWQRFRTARDEMRRRGDVYLSDNLAKKEALCAAVEPLADSTEWNATAAAIQRMQAEWKEIGPVRQALSEALFERFRAPANRFFDRRKEFLRATKERRDELLGHARQLCEAVEALADSTDWEATAVELKRLQGEAQDVWGRRRAPAAPPAFKGPRQTEVLRQRFQAACDRFFERYRRRDDVELEATLAAAERILADLDALRGTLAGPDAPTRDQVTQSLNERLSQWAEIGPLPPNRASALRQRLQAACDAIEAACPDGLPDSELAAASNLEQREKLCARLERLLASLTSTDEPAATDLATRLKLALAANTIGGRAATQREQALREAAETGERLREKWQRLGLVIGHRARALAQRFDKAGAELHTLCGPYTGVQKPHTGVQKPPPRV